MISFIPPRLRKPLGYALVGAVYAAAWALRGGDGWWWSVTIIVCWVPLVIGVYVRGGRDTDEGALAGSRADERLRLATTRARALALEVVMITAFAGVAAAIAVKGDWWWPFAVILGVGAFVYFLSLGLQGVGEDDSADDANAVHQVASPVS